MSDSHRQDPPESVETLGWALGQTSSPGVDDTPGSARVSDDELRAYRARTLSAAARNALEEALLADGGLRRRLARLDRPAAAPGPDRLRERVLAAFDQEWSPGEAPRSSGARPGPGGRLARWAQRSGTRWLALAACALLALVLAWPRPQPLPADLVYLFQGRGLAELRSGTEAPTSILRARPETVIRLEARPNRALSAQVGLYWRGSAPVYERLPQQGVVDGNGLWRLEVTAGDLLGSRLPGRGQLVLVVVPPELDLPARLEPAQLAAWVSAHRLHLQTLEFEGLVSEPGPNADSQPARRSP